MHAAASTSASDPHPPTHPIHLLVSTTTTRACACASARSLSLAVALSRELSRSLSHTRAHAHMRTRVHTHMYGARARVYTHAHARTIPTTRSASAVSRTSLSRWGALHRTQARPPRRALEAAAVGAARARERARTALPRRSSARAGAQLSTRLAPAALQWRPLQLRGAQARKQRPAPTGPPPRPPPPPPPPPRVKAARARRWPRTLCRARTLARTWSS